MHLAGLQLVSLHFATRPPDHLRGQLGQRNRRARDTLTVHVSHFLRLLQFLMRLTLISTRLLGLGREDLSSGSLMG